MPTPTTPATPDELNARFAIPDVARFEAGENGLPRLVLTAEGAEAHVYLHGAHVTHYAPAGAQPVIWMSGLSRFAEGFPIRGGVPIVFPWFASKTGDPDAPMHGLVRQADWDIAEVDQSFDGRAFAAFTLTVDAFKLTYKVTVGPTLKLALTVKNTGADPATFEEALHTYLDVADIQHVRVKGLEGARYIDKVRRFEIFTQDGPLAFTGETDSVYLDTESTVTVDDPAPGRARTLTVAKTGSRSTIIWNPWDAKAAKMMDFRDTEWPGMLCVETANVADNAVTLEPGKSHTMTATIGVGSTGR